MPCRKKREKGAKFLLQGASASDRGWPKGGTCGRFRRRRKGGRYTLRREGGGGSVKGGLLGEGRFLRRSRRENLKKVRGSFRKGDHFAEGVRRR